MSYCKERDVFVNLNLYNKIQLLILIRKAAKTETI